MIFDGVMIFFSFVFTFFNGLAREVEVESVFSVSTASSDWIGLVLTFFNGLAREVEVESEPALVSSLKQMIFDGVMIFFSSVFTFFNGLAREVEVESVFSVSTASSDWIGLVLTFFNGLAREVEVESETALVSSLQQKIFDGVMIFFSSVFTFFNGLAREVEVESVFSVSTASSDWIGLVLTFFNGLAREVEVESV